MKEEDWTPTDLDRSVILSRMENEPTLVIVRNAKDTGHTYYRFKQDQEESMKLACDYLFTSLAELGHHDIIEQMSTPLAAAMGWERI